LNSSLQIRVQLFVAEGSGDCLRYDGRGSCLWAETPDAKAAVNKRLTERFITLIMYTKRLFDKDLVAPLPPKAVPEDFTDRSSRR